ncbi:MAG: glycosyltransferase [Pseudomonadota bacterium]
MPRSIALVLKGYPRLSETFIAQEIHALELQGLDILIFSLRHPYDPATHPIHDEIKAPVHYLPEYTADDIPRVLRAWRAVRKWRGYKKARSLFLRDFKRDPTTNRLRRFTQAMVLAFETPDHVDHYYAHFLHTPASVTRYASAIRSLRWSCSAHAKDIWTIPEWEKRDKLASVDWLVTCTSANHEHLSALASDPAKVSLVYHGLDFGRFTEAPESTLARDGNDASDPVRIISVGRAVDKKGYTYLLEALANLPKDLNWRFQHIGGGELLETLKRQAQQLNIATNIDWHGAKPQTEVLECYRDSDIFVLPSVVSEDGDRDGLPNVLMEAQSQKLACISTDISGIPELILHRKTGWLVGQRDSEALTKALKNLIVDPDKRNSLADAGFERVRAHFAMQNGIDVLFEKFTTTKITQS